MKKILLFLSFFMVSCSINDEHLSTTISTELEDNREINLSKLNDFEWDSMIVLSPYMSVERIAKEYSLEFSTVDKHIVSSDVINVLVFLKARKAVKSCILSRQLGDFECRGRIIPKIKANFKVIADSLGSTLHSIVLK